MADPDAAHTDSPDEQNSPDGTADEPTPPTQGDAVDAPEATGTEDASPDENETLLSGIEQRTTHDGEPVTPLRHPQALDGRAINRRLQKFKAAPSNDDSLSSTSPDAAGHPAAKATDETAVAADPTALAETLKHLRDPGTGEADVINTEHGAADVEASNDSADAMDSQGSQHRESPSRSDSPACTEQHDSAAKTVAAGSTAHSEAATTNASAEQPVDTEEVAITAPDAEPSPQDTDSPDTDSPDTDSADVDTRQDAAALAGEVGHNVEPDHDATVTSAADQPTPQEPQAGAWIVANAQPEQSVVSDEPQPSEGPKPAAEQDPTDETPDEPSAVDGAVEVSTTNDLNSLLAPPATSSKPAGDTNTTNDAVHANDAVSTNDAKNPGKAATPPRADSSQDVATAHVGEPDDSSTADQSNRDATAESSSVDQGNNTGQEPPEALDPPTSAGSQDAADGHAATAATEPTAPDAAATPQAATTPVDHAPGHPLPPSQGAAETGQPQQAQHVADDPAITSSFAQQHRGTDNTTTPHEPYSTVGAWHRVGAALKPSWSRSQLLGALLCGILGFALVVQFKHSKEDNLGSLRNDELVSMLDDLNVRSDRLKSERLRLAAAEQELQSSGDQQAAAAAAAQERLTELSILAGVTAVKGPGVQVTITDPNTVLTPYHLLNAVQELRDAGAEAQQINDQRIVANTAFTRVDGAIAINGHVVQQPFTILAIGDSTTLSSALQIRGGVETSVLSKEGAGISIKAQDLVQIDAVVQAPRPGVAKPTS